MAKAQRISKEEAVRIEDAILGYLAEGLSLRAACEEEDVPVSVRWFTCRLAKCEELRDRFNAAKATGCFLLQDSIEDHWDDLDRDLRETKTINTDAGPLEVPKYDPKLAASLVMSTRSRVESRKWTLAKMLPRIYGDKLQVTDGDGKSIPHVSLAIAPPSQDG